MPKMPFRAPQNMFMLLAQHSNVTPGNTRVLCRQYSHLPARPSARYTLSLRLTRANVTQKAQIYADSQKVTRYRNGRNWMGHRFFGETVQDRVVRQSSGKFTFRVSATIPYLLQCSALQLPSFSAYICDFCVLKKISVPDYTPLAIRKMALLKILSTLKFTRIPTRKSSSLR